jgi:hypothetical protein
VAFAHQEGFAIRICSPRAKLRSEQTTSGAVILTDLPSENRGMSVARRDRGGDMFFRAFIVWVALLALAIVNGAARETWLVPRIGGPAGHAVSSLSLSAAILLLAWLTIAWIDPASARDAFLIGLAWLALTLAFEFIGGHYLFRKPWNELLADYDVMSGRIWVLVLVTTMLAPLLAELTRHFGDAR